MPPPTPPGVSVLCRGQCCAVLRRGEGGGEGAPAVALSPCGRGPAAIHRHRAGRRLSHAAHTSRHSSQSGAGLRALRPQGSSGGAEGRRTSRTPVTPVTSCVHRKVCTPSRAAGASKGGRGTGAAPYRWVGVIPRTRSGSPRVASPRRSRGVPGCSCQRSCPLSFCTERHLLWLARTGERLLRAKLFRGGVGAQNQVQSRAEYHCTLLFSSAISQWDLAAPLETTAEPGSLSDF